MTPPAPTDACPLCLTDGCGAYFRDNRDYYQCPSCRLVFVPQSQLPSRDEEKSHYDLHENSPDDADYRRFLSRLFEPVSNRLKRPGQGLDFGSGPGPTLSLMFEEAGHRMEIYDAYYAPDRTPLKTTNRYDFITASEVVEHLHRPRIELDCLWECLNPGGILGVMTKRVRDREAFSRWHYKNDPTHVCFFSVATFEWLSRQWGASMAIEGDDVVLFEKPAARD